MAKRKTDRAPRSKTRPSNAPTDEIVLLKQKLKDAEDALSAIRTGAVDALVVSGPEGEQVFTLKDADRPYRAVLENMRDGALTVRMDGLILFANRQFAAIVGLPLETVLGHDLYAFVGPRSRPDLERLFDRARTEGAFAEIEFTGEVARAVIINLSLAPVTVEGLQVLAGVAADITAERQARQKIRQMERTEALGRLAGGVAHDLNNILQPIIVNAELLIDEIGQAGSKRDLLNNIIEAANRQRDLVKKILSFTRPTQQDLRPLALTPLVVEAINLLKPSLPKGVDFRLIDEARADVVKGDPTELHELVTNLCTNAADAMEKTGGTIEVALRNVALTRENVAYGLKPGRYLKLDVKDTGCGIAPEHLDKVFDPFFTTKETGRGTGIGLSVVHGIVKSHGGSIFVQSQIGKGTDVVVFLPVTAASIFEAATLGRDWKRASPDRRVLVVDDEEFVLDTMRRALVSLGHKPTVFKDPRGALALIRGLPRHFDIAIIDQTMPKMSGLELASQIRTINSDMPIILATGYSKAVDEAAFRAAGVTAVVMKPLGLRNLATIINQALESRGRAF